MVVLYPVISYKVIILSAERGKFCSIELSYITAAPHGFPSSVIIYSTRTTLNCTTQPTIYSAYI